MQQDEFYALRDMDNRMRYQSAFRRPFPFPPADNHWDLRDRSVLKLHEVKSAMPTREDDTAYFSEPELDPSSFERRAAPAKVNGGPSIPPGSMFANYGPRHYSTLGSEYRRPASTLPMAPPKPQRFSSTNTTPVTTPTRSPFPPQPFEPLDAYQPRADSNTGSLPRSGSATPVIDEEARIRMDFMENQLSSLSNLVHSALMSQRPSGLEGKSAANEAVYRDIESIRKEIFGDDLASESGSVSRYSDLGSDSFAASSDRDALHSTASSDNLVNPELRQSLRLAKKRTRELQTELRQLRRAAQINAQSSRTLIRDAFERVKVILHSNKHLQLFGQPPDMLERDPLQMERHLADHEQDRIRTSTQGLEKDMLTLEKEIEQVRHKVINGHRRLRVTEVESFTEKLTHVGKSAAVMKSQFPNFQQRLKNVMAAEMEKVVKEERFLKTEPEKIDGILRRCKKLANTMVTMKKLALVQDPVTPVGPAPIYESAPNYSSQDDNAQTIKAIESKVLASRRSSDRDIYSRPTAPADPPLVRKTSDTSILDSILEELRSATAPQRSVKFGPSSVLKTPEAPRRTADAAPSQKRSPPNGTLTRDDKYDKHDHVEPSLYTAPPPPPPPLNGVRENHVVEETLLDRISKAQSNLKPTPSPTGNGSVAPYGFTRSTSLRSSSSTPSSHGWSGRAFSAPRPPPSMLIPPPSSSGAESGSYSPRRSTTPNSITSEPGFLYSPSRRPAPPPPPRSASRGPTLTNKYTDDEISRMKQQLMNSHVYQNAAMGHRGRGTSHTPTPSIRTDAIIDDIDFRMMRSASSSESVNSQDGSLPSYGRHVPPPPPTRAMYR